TIPVAQDVRPPYTSGTDEPQKEPVDYLPVPPQELTPTKVYLNETPTTLADTIDVPGKEDLYEVLASPGSLVEIDLDASSGADSKAVASTLDAVIEIWHEGESDPVAVLDDEIIKTGDVNLRYAPMDPPTVDHRVPPEGRFWVKVRAYYWPAEGTQAGLSRGQRSAVDGDSTYRLTLTGSGAACIDPNSDGVLNSADLLSMIAGYQAKRSTDFRLDLNHDQRLDPDDLFFLTTVWSGEVCPALVAK
ncbi:MAG: hypothetical protein IT434_19090, partial [Phycisphaerales bacterium]|nr:hypothetical protein [Phycisphaerales bacterium]